MTVSAPPAGSYSPHATVPGGLPAEADRLERQARLTWEPELAVLRRQGLLRPSAHGPLRLLDLGCGSGASLRLLDPLPERPRLFGVDVDAELLSLATACGVGRAALVRADATALPFGDARFDGVLARYLVQHLTDPLATLRQARRILAPGGWLAVVEVDDQLWGLADPVDLSLEPIFRRAGQEARGGDRVVLRRVPRLLRAAGFVDVTVHPFAVSSEQHELARLAVHLEPDRLLPALARGAIELSEYMQVAMAHQRLLRDPEAFVLLLGFLVLGRRPPATESSVPTTTPKGAP